LSGVEVRMIDKVWQTLCMCIDSLHQTI